MAGWMKKTVPEVASEPAVVKMKRKPMQCSTPQGNSHDYHPNRRNYSTQEMGTRVGGDEEQQQQDGRGEDESAGGGAAESNSTLPSFQLLSHLRNPHLSESRKIELSWMFSKACCWQSNWKKGENRVAIDELLPASQFLSLVSEWIQSSLIASAKHRFAYPDTSHKYNTSFLDSCDKTPLVSCFDVRYWSVLKWCLQSGYLQTAGVISPGLIRPVLLVLTAMGETLHKCTVSNSEVTCMEEIDLRSELVMKDTFLKAFIDTINLLIFSDERAFIPDLNSWVLLTSTVIDISFLLFDCGSIKKAFISNVKLLYHLAAIMLEGFSRFASSHPKPKKIFQIVINRLLESLLRILGILHEEDETFIEAVYGREKKKLLKCVEDVLRHVLFHPAHLEGYLEICSFTEQNTEVLESFLEVENKLLSKRRRFINNTQEGDSSIMLSYHKLLFQQLNHFQRDWKSETWVTFPFLLKTFVQEVRAQHLTRSRDACGTQGRRASIGFTASQPSTNIEDNLLVGSVKDFTKISSIHVKTPKMGSTTLTSQRIFQFFSKLISLLTNDLKGLLESFLSKESTVKLLHIHRLLRAVNKMLSVAQEEHLYIPTEDTSGHTHFRLLQYIFSVIIDLSIMVPELSLSLHYNFQSSAADLEEKIQSRFEEDRYDFKMLSALSREVICGISCILKLEYRVIEHNLKDIWLIIFLTVAVQCRIKEAFQTNDAFAEDAVLLASQLVKHFGDLRQVDRPLYDLCRTLRFFMYPRGIMDAKKLDVEEGSKTELKAAASRLPTKHSAIAIEFVVCSFQFLETVHMAIKCLPEGQVACFINSLREDVDFTFQFLVLAANFATDCDSLLLHSGGNALMDLYMGFLDNSNVTTSNSTQVGSSIRDLMVCVVSPVLNILVDECTSDPVNLLTTFRLWLLRSVSESTKQSFTCDKLCFDEANMPETIDMWLLVCSLIVAIVLRLYMSSRSLHRECIGLMPPIAARKASNAANDMTMIGFSTNWIESGSLLHKHFPFIDIEYGSISVYNFLKQLDVALKKGYEQVPVLSYTLHCIALQHLVDLRRHMKSINFFLDEMKLKNSMLVSSDFMDEVEDPVTTGERSTYHIVQWKKKGDFRKFHKLIKELRQEASSLASFMVRNVHYLDKSCKRSYQTGNCKSKCRQREKLEKKYDQKSFLKAKWVLLCQSIDIWAECAAEGVLNEFVCIFLSIASQRSFYQLVSLGQGPKEGLEELTYQIVKLFKSSHFYEQKVIRKAFLSNICHELECSLAWINQGLTISCPKRLKSDLKNSDFQNWKGWKMLIEMIRDQTDVIGESVRKSFNNDVLSAVKPANATTEAFRKRKSVVHPSEHSIDTKNPGDANKMITLFTKCFNMLNLISWLPKGYLDAHSAAICIRAIVGFERFTTWSLLERWSSCEIGTKICTNEIVQCIEFFATCRRALIAIVSNPDPDQRILFQNITSSSYSWMLLSIPAVVICGLDVLAKSLDNSVVPVVESFLLSTVRCTTAFFTFVGEYLVNFLLGSHLLLPENNDRVKSSSRSMPLESECHAAAESLTKVLYKQMRDVMHIAEEMKLGYLHDSSHASTTNFQTEFYFVKNAYKLAASAAAARSLLWAITTFLDSMDQKCHLDKTSSTKWSGKLPTSLLSYLKDMELLVTRGLDQLLYAGADRENIVNNASLIMDGRLSKTKINSMNLLTKQETRNEEDPLASDVFVPYMRDDFRIEDMNCECQDQWKKDKQGFELIEGRQKNLLAVGSTGSPGKISELLEITPNQKSILSCMLLQKETEQENFLSELYMAMAAIIRLKSLFCSPNMLEHGMTIFDNSWTFSLNLHIGAACSLMLEAATSIKPGIPFCFSLILGVLKYVESIGSFLPHVRPILSPGAFIRVVEAQLALFGAMIAFGEGNLELARESTNLKCYHKEFGSSDGILSQHGTIVNNKLAEEIKGALRNSFTMLLKKPLMLHLRTMMQTIERALLGFDGAFCQGYGVETGNLIDRRVRCHVAGAVECLSLCLSAISGKKRLQLLEKYCENFLSATFDIITYCEAAFSVQVTAFLVPTHAQLFDKNGVSVATVLLKCIEILGLVMSREAIYPIGPNFVVQAMYCPASLFKPFYEEKMAKYRLLDSLSVSDENLKSYACQSDSTIFRSETLVKIYVACCKLLCSLLHHRKRECGHCVALLQDSMRTLLFFLEISKLNADILTIEAAVCGATWLKRVYEEIAEQKQTFGKYCGYILSDYICVISGYGVTMNGLDRDIDVVLRPGIYALVDACSADSLQQLHAVLGEGPRRSALLTLRSDYEKHFKYIGKV